MIKAEWEKVWDLKCPILLEKSPPNLMHAFDIERTFEQSYFIVMIRDPYAFAEGLTRRKITTLEGAADFWRRCAEHQIQNIKGLQHVLYFTYEDFTHDPEATSERILRFLPQLEGLDHQALFQVHSILGNQPRRITDMNQIKIRQLSPREIKAFNHFLQPNLDLLAFFNYELIQPNFRHSLMHYQSQLGDKVRDWLHRTTHFSRRVIRKLINARRYISSAAIFG
jgi:hypothetical protein